MENSNRSKNRFKSPKTVEQRMFLERQFAIDPTWNKETVELWVEELGLNLSKVYKWGYDRKHNVAENNKSLSPKESKLFDEFPSLLEVRYKQDLNDEVDEILESVIPKVTQKSKWANPCLDVISSNFGSTMRGQSTIFNTVSCGYKFNSTIGYDKNSEELICDTTFKDNELFGIQIDPKPKLVHLVNKNPNCKTVHQQIPPWLDRTEGGDANMPFLDINTINELDTHNEYKKWHKVLKWDSRTDHLREAQFSSYLFK